ncbi:MAG TPA: pyridoxal phosphate-dependent aminotransferase [Candidatus Eisenbacteria bacterium]|nr:pyridoxal phosphate-dependent aminotransferase [Candidatus Eisenbacteria bacterium]
MNRRLPDAAEPNALARLLAERRRAGASGRRALIDLTVTNPTAVGLVALDESSRGALADERAAAYDPDPRGLRSAREAIAAAFGRADAPLDPARVVLTASSSESYAHLFRLLCEPGDDVAVPRPSYPLLEPIARLEDVALESYRLAYDGRWRLDLDSLEAAVGPRTRAIVLVEPNNPTGSVLSPEERRAVEALAERRGVAIVADEVFGEFPWEEGRLLPTWGGARTVPTFVLGGISKSCGLPQLKLGWISIGGPSRAVERLAPGLEWILDLFLSVGTPVQLALPRLLAVRGAFRDAALARMRSNLSAWRGWAARVGGGILEADGGWSVMARLPSAAGPHRDPAEWALEVCDVLLHPAHFYDFEDDRHVVASLLAEPRSLEAALRRLEDGMAARGEG